MDDLQQIFSQENNLPTIALNLLILLVVAISAYYICRFILRQIVQRLISNSASLKHSTLADPVFIKHLCKLVPWIIIQIGIDLLPNLPEAFSQVTHNVATAITLLYGMLAIGAFLDAIIEYQTQKGNSRIRSIKSYIQLAKIALYVLGGICIIAALIDRSPAILLSGLGAMSAVTMLVFKDTILSFVAGVQISSNDMLRLGDWIEMPQVGADGDVIDIALHTIKVQNWDKTITTIPTWRLMSESFRNWRGMQESGGRRIKRSIKIDVTSVGFLNLKQFETLSQIKVLQNYLSDKRIELEKYNTDLGEAAQMIANRRRLTNIGTFRAYAYAYLKAHPNINQNMTCMVRQLEPTAEGIPIEIYCFTSTVVWTEYEGIQGDIFDHLISILPEFGLRAYQQPSGHDMSTLMSSASHTVQQPQAEK